MTILPLPIIMMDNLSSTISILLATIATLRAASRLQYRISHNGSIGLMDGPPILGPARVTNKVEEIGDREYNMEEKKDIDDDKRIIDASPLWEHTEAFRKAVILGLLFDSSDITSSVDNSLFSNIVHYEGKSSSLISSELRGGSDDDDDDFAITAAIEAGLLVPTQSKVARGGGG